MPNAIVTGGSRGLGLALCTHLLSNNWNVVSLSRTSNKEVDYLARKYASYKWLQCDVTDDNAVKAANTAIEFLGGHLDLLINNAGISGWSVGIEKTTTEEISKLLDTHTFGALRITQATIHALKASKKGHIINISSRLGSIAKTAAGDFFGRNFSYSYRIAKASLNMLSACIAEEFSKDGILVSVLHPGLFYSGTASTDASMSTNEAAERIYKWLEQRDNSPIVYLEPGANYLPW